MTSLAVPYRASPPSAVAGLARAARSMSGHLAAVLRWPAPAGAYRRLLDPLADGTGVRATVEAVIPETARAATVVLRPGRGWRPHRPGQWVSLGVDIDGVRHHRCYSITSLPADPATIAGGAARITVTVQAVPDGTVSNHLVSDLRPGTVVHLDGPDGDFTLDDADADTPVLFITGGSGITPVIGMLRAIDAGLSPVGDAVVLHHAPTADESLFAEEIEAIARRRADVAFHLTETGPDAPPRTLELTAARLDALCPDWRRRSAWTCGPRPLTDAVARVWATPGADPATLHVERFQPTVAVDADRCEGTVTFSASGSSTESDGTDTLLDLAESAGLTPLSGCRMGVCRRCVVPLRSGTVRDLRDGRTESSPGTHVQICVSAAVGDVDVEL